MSRRKGAERDVDFIQVGLMRIGPPTSCQRVRTMVAWILLDTVDDFATLHETMWRKGGSITDGGTHCSSPAKGGSLSPMCNHAPFP